MSEDARNRKTVAETAPQYVPRETGATLFARYFVRSADPPSRGFDVGSDLGVADAIEAGVPATAVDEVIAAGWVDAGAIYELVLPRRTLAHRKSKDQRLTSKESDRLARVLRVYARSEDALGDPERAHRWMRKPNRALSGRTPLRLLSSEAGARAVEKVLGRIEHGVFS